MFKITYDKTIGDTYKLVLVTFLLSKFLISDFFCIFLRSDTCFQTTSWSVRELRGESHIDFRTQCVIIMLTDEGL